MSIMGRRNKRGRGRPRKEDGRKKPKTTSGASKANSSFVEFDPSASESDHDSKSESHYDSNSKSAKNAKKKKGRSFTSSIRFSDEPEFDDLLSTWEENTPSLGGWTGDMYALLEEKFPELLIKHGYFGTDFPTRKKLIQLLKKKQTNGKGARYRVFFTFCSGLFFLCSYFFFHGRDTGSTYSRSTRGAARCTPYVRGWMGGQGGTGSSITPSHFPTTSSATFSLMASLGIQSTPSGMASPSPLSSKGK